VISITRGELSEFSIAEISLASVAGWVYLTVAGTLVAFAAYIWLLKQVNPTLVSTYTFVNPVIAVALGWAFLDETLTIWMLAGAIMIIVSVSGLLLTGRRSVSADKEPPAFTARASSRIRCTQRHEG
jgi:drug/metabolite transporter (DMT)-like permease